MTIEEWLAEELEKFYSRIRDELEKFPDEDKKTELHMIDVIKNAYKEFEIMLTEISDPHARENLKQVRNLLRELSEHKLPPEGSTRLQKEQTIFFEQIRSLYTLIGNSAYSFRKLNENSQK